MKLSLTFIFLFTLFCALNGFGQTDSAFLTRTVNSLEKYALANPIEKVYLHLDKQEYMPGDTIWFKAYTVAGPNHGLSAIGNIVHVELLTQKDSVIGRIALALSSGISWGDFALPVLIKTGAYHIRAYTNWMRNFSPDYFFDQAIRVSEGGTALAQKKLKALPDPDVQFFPEGGSLVNGLRSKVAIKAVGTSGMGEDLEGSVIDNDGTEVSVFSCQHLGMGVFAITPQAGKSYRVKITRKDGRQFTVTLPKAQDDGFAIAINNSQVDSISIRVAASANLLDSKKEAKYYLLAQSGAKVYYTADFKLSAQSFTTLIDKKRFPTGIVQFTLFAGNGEPLNERVVFIRRNDQLKLNLTSAREAYTTRQKVDIQIKVSAPGGKPALGSFSAAVIDQDLANLDKTSAQSIFSTLLLTSDIKGYIEQPEYYFTNVTAKTNNDLDILMLTQGYHRFEWKQVLNETYPAITYQPESSLSVSGYIKTFHGNPIPRGRLMLYNMQRGWFKLDTLSDDNGRFTFDGLISNPDTTLKYVIQGRTATNKNKLDITLDTIAPFKKQANIGVYHWLATDAGDTVQLTPYQHRVKQQIKVSLDKRVIPLKEVVIKDTQYHLVGAPIPDQFVKFPKENTGQTLAQFLSVRLSAISFMDGLPYTYRTIARTPAGLAPTPMNIMIDGLYIDNTVFSMLNLADFESAEVYRTTGKIDITTGKGEILLLTTKRHTRETIKQVTPDVITYNSTGLYKAREFYSPKYSVVNESTSTNDLRTTIYWKPDIITDKDGNATFSFYNADTTGTYRVTIEGIDADGNLGRSVFTYNVQ